MRNCKEVPNNIHTKTIFTSADVDEFLPFTVRQHHQKISNSWSNRSIYHKKS
jgi:hypothetical protein